MRLAARILEIEATTLHAAERSRCERIERGRSPITILLVDGMPITCVSWAPDLTGS